MNIHAVIRGTKTIEEFKSRQKIMNDFAEKAFMEHMKLIDGVWHEGAPVKCWHDDDGYFCVEYASGKWWHYLFHENKAPDIW